MPIALVFVTLVLFILKKNKKDKKDRLRMILFTLKYYLPNARNAMAREIE
jgi:hypothetical protein